MDVDGPKGEGFRSYYIQKIEELQLIVAEKSQNLRRLQAQRNELNAKGTYVQNKGKISIELLILHSSHAARGTAAATGAGQLCRRGCQANGQEEGPREGASRG